MGYAAAQYWRPRSTVYSWSCFPRLWDWRLSCNPAPGNLPSLIATDCEKALIQALGWKYHAMRTEPKRSDKWLHDFKACYKIQKFKQHAYGEAGSVPGTPRVTVRSEASCSAVQMRLLLDVRCIVRFTTPPVSGTPKRGLSSVGSSSPGLWFRKRMWILLA